MNLFNIFMNEYRSDRNIGIHCLPLVALTFLVNLIKSNHTFVEKSYWLTAFLCFNYFFVTIIWKQKKDIFCLTYLISLILVSYAFAYYANRLLSLDSVYVIFVFNLISNYAYSMTIERFPPIFKCSFSFGELLIVSQTSVAYLSTAIACAFTKLLRSQNHCIFCSEYLPNHVIQIIFVGISSIIILMFVKPMGRTIDFGILIVNIFGTYLALNHILNTEPIIWLISFILNDKNRINLLMFWLTILVITLIFTYCYSILAKQKATTITRKFFHISISLVFLIGMKNDLKFLIFSSAVIFALFLIIEIMRIRRLPPFGDQIQFVFNKFRDEKEKGLLTLSHIYLLIGCSLPLWIYPFDKIESPLAVASGLITVGFGDTAASIGGSLMGKNYWKGSHKTYEGTCFAIIAQLVASIIVSKYFMAVFHLSIYNCLILTIISIIVALIEAKIEEIDNLVLPLYYYILVQIFIN